MRPRLAGALIALIVVAAATWLLWSERQTVLTEGPAGLAVAGPALAMEPARADEIPPPPPALGLFAAAPPPAPNPPAGAEPPSDLRQQLPPGLRPPVANRDVDGGVRFPLTRAGIRAAVQDSKAQVQECYQEWLNANAAPAGQPPPVGRDGQLTIDLRILTDGGPDAVIDHVHLLSDAGVEKIAFEGCVLAVMSSLHFDAPAQGTLSVTYPLSFSNDGGPGAP
jgi:hypothetical protein